MNGTQFNTIIEMLGATQAAVLELGVRMDRLELRMDRLEAQIEKLEARIIQLEVRMGKLEVQVNKLEERVGRLEVRIGKLEVRIDSVDNRLSVTESTLLQFREDFNTHVAKSDNAHAEIIITLREAIQFAGEHLQLENHKVRARFGNHEGRIKSIEQAIF